MFRRIAVAAALILAIARPFPARAQEDRDAVFFGFRATLNGHAADFPDDPSDPMPDGYARFCKALADRGLSFLVLQTAYREGDTLRTCVGVDLLAGGGVQAGVVSTLRDKVLLAKAAKIKIYADISEIAAAGMSGPGGDGSTGGPLAGMQPSQVNQLLEAIAAEGFDGFYSDQLPGLWREAMADFTQQKRLKFMLGEAMSPSDARILATWVTPDHSFRDIGLGDFMHALALGYANYSLSGVRLKSEGDAGRGWTNPAVARNVALFRVFSTRSRGILFSSPAGRLPPDFGVAPAEGAPKLFDQVAGVIRNRTRPPVCNILTDLTPQDFGDGATERGPGKFGYNFSVVVRAIIAAGLDAVITTEPLDDADVYYLYLKGLEGDRTANSFYASNEGRDVPEAHLNLIRKGNKPIFLQVATLVPSSNITGSSNWLTVREYFGLNQDKHYPALKPDEIPDQGVYNSKWYMHTNSQWTVPGGGGALDPLGAKMQWMTGILKDDVDPEVEILSLGYQAGNSLVLACRRFYRGGKPNYFINGSVLDPQALFLLTNLLTEGRGMGEPAGYLYAAGETNTAVLAIENTVVNFQLPGRTTGGYAWTRYAPDGTVSKGTDIYDPKEGIKNLKLEEGTLMVLEPRELK